MINDISILNLNTIINPHLNYAPNTAGNNAVLKLD